MKVNKSELKQIIKEEITRLLSENCIITYRADGSSFTTCPDDARYDQVLARAEGVEAEPTQSIDTSSADYVTSSADDPGSFGNAPADAPGEIPWPRAPLAGPWTSGPITPDSRSWRDRWKERYVQPDDPEYYVSTSGKEYYMDSADGDREKLKKVSDARARQKIVSDATWPDRQQKHEASVDKYYAETGKEPPPWWHSDPEQFKHIDIREQIEHIIKEADVTQVYEVVADLTYTREGDRDQADILTEIRAIEGVTIVTILIPAQGGRKGEAETVRVRIKFRPLIDGVSVGLQTYIPALKRTVARVGGVRSFDISLASKY